MPLMLFLLFTIYKKESNRYHFSSEDSYCFQCSHFLKYLHDNSLNYDYRKLSHAITLIQYSDYCMLVVIFLYNPIRSCLLFLRVINLAAFQQNQICKRLYLGVERSGKERKNKQIFWLNVVKIPLSILEGKRDLKSQYCYLHF